MRLWIQYSCNLVLLTYIVTTASVSLAIENTNEYELGPIQFDIPPGYLFAYHPPASPESAGGIILRALLPNLEPRTTANAALFDGSDWGKHVLVATIHYNEATLSGDRLLSMWRAQMQQAKPVSHIEDFAVYPLKTVPSSLYVNEHSGDLRFFTCDNDPSGFGAQFVVVTQCDVIEQLYAPSLREAINGRYPLVIEYTLSKAFLPDIIKIDAQLRSLLATFETSAAPHR